MATEAHTIPQALVERFSSKYAEFLGAVRAAVDEALKDPAAGANKALPLWQLQALPRLENKNGSIREAAALCLAGKTDRILSIASKERHLAKELDGFSLDFAGPERAKVLDELETGVVLAAYEICAAAGIP